MPYSLERLKKESKNTNRHFRYNWAKKFITPTDSVLDAGCGSAFGSEMLAGSCSLYQSVDYSAEAEPTIVADMNTWEPDFDFDIFIGFESIEHVKNTEHYVSVAKRAKRMIFITCPASETISWNPHHVYDFTVPQILRLFEDEQWAIADHFLRIVKQGQVIQQCWAFARV